MQFFLGHLLATALTLWATTVIIEALESYAHALHGGHHDNSSDHGDNSDHEIYDHDYDGAHNGNDHYEDIYSHNGTVTLATFIMTRMAAHWSATSTDIHNITTAGLHHDPGSLHGTYLK